MKFAKEIDQLAVPEWRVKYLDYKQGKKKVKAVGRAVRNANGTPRTNPDLPPRPLLGTLGSLYGSTSPFTPRRKQPSAPKYDGANDEPIDPLRTSPAPLGVNTRPNSNASGEDASNGLKKTAPMSIPGHRNSAGTSDGLMGYGSFVATPPIRERQPFELPGPALTPVPTRQLRSSLEPSSDVEPPPALQRSASGPIPPQVVPYRSTFASLKSRLPKNQDVRPFVRRMLSVGTPLTKPESHRLEETARAVDQVKTQQKEFFNWMDEELDKIETFYKMKEDHAGDRLKVLREQLHEMRNRRIQEVAEAQEAKAIRKRDELAISRHSAKADNKKDGSRPSSREHFAAWMQPVERLVDQTKARIAGPRPGSNSKALQTMEVSPELRAKNPLKPYQPNQPNQPSQNLDENRDYVRRPRHDDVPYRVAKRKLKTALQEFYRGMELLKAYALLNQKAFRKINKKYDKAIDAHPPLRYMSEKVNKAWFVQSDVLDGHLHSVEDLYARYFERGNRKIATAKLKSASGKSTDQSGSAFWNGMLIGIGGVFGIQGLIYGADLLKDADSTVRFQTSYLLQIYGGYFLALYLFCWFCLDCSIWTRNKINYTFVFEFDPRNNLDWRQLSEFPSFLVFLLGLFLWVNFSRYGTQAMFIYYPIILIFVTALIIFLPFPILFHRSRRWFVYSHWRLLLAGLYPVEFRDFFLGDMYCSLTYFMSNIELFFCLYATYWHEPTRCNSTSSRLLGFFSTLPGIWRALQCLRRYYDTRNIFPHLVNCGKYGMTILYYVTLSLYRINRSRKDLALFSTFAALNAVYVSVWDLLMDWSLLQPQANKRFLRDVRGYKSTWWYYAAMILDPILRFNWIFYSIYTEDLQHSSIVSFLIGFSEVTRRGIWTLFRVENEHCSNVAHFKASRDIPLPYTLEICSQGSFAQPEQLSTSPRAGTATGAETSPSLARRASRTGSLLEAQDATGMRRRAGTLARTFTRVLADAHMQDFEKKRRPGAGDSDSLENVKRDGSVGPVEDARSSSDEEDDDEQDREDMFDAEELTRQARREGDRSERKDS